MIMHVFSWIICGIQLFLSIFACIEGPTVCTFPREWKLILFLGGGIHDVVHVCSSVHVRVRCCWSVIHMVTLMSQYNVMKAKIDNLFHNL